MLKLREDGFTIVEIITGLVVMVIFVAGIAIVTNNLVFINDRSYDLVLINGLAENKIESLRSQSFGALEDGSYDFSDELPRSIGAPKTATYTISTSTDPDVGTALKTIEIQIDYTEGRTAQTANFTTHIAELGIGQ